MNIDTIWNVCHFIVVMFEFCGLAMLVTVLAGAMFGEDVDDIPVIGTLWRVLFDIYQDEEELYDYD